MSRLAVDDRIIENNSPDAETSRDLTAARRVLELESESLQSLSAAIGAEFIAAVDLLQSVRGRVIITGMGKSGHIGRKIAATFASTGTMAHYVHPGEASHGDLGMIGSDDGILALSYSGDTAELKDLIAYARFRALPFLAIVGRAPSALSNAADVTLLLPPMPEACPMGLAPTTSTTMMLALGDALAVALMERHGFSPDDFRVFHPGGRLGQQFIKVEDIMHSGDEIPLVATGTEMTVALDAMTSGGFGCIGIVDANGHLAGVITDGDLRRKIRDGIIDKSVDDIMTSEPKTIAPKALAAEALNMMNSSEHPFTTLFVSDNGKVLGVLHMHDILRAGIA
jgi:arabinose-5-phosphate isomerase